MKNSDYHVLSKEIAHLNAAYSLLYWDLETQAPSGSTAWRAETLGHFAGLVHGKVSDPRYEDALRAELANERDPVRREAFARGLEDLQKARLIPQKLVEETSQAAALAQEAWQKAKEAKDFSLFAPHLTTMIRLTKERAQHIAQGQDPYDALLDEYSPGMRQAEIDKLFAALKPKLQELLAKRKPVARRPWRVPIEVQEKLCTAVIEWMGFPKDHLVQARSAHPFCLSLHPSDVRVTTRYREDDPLMSLMSTVHELGHALYEHQLPSTDPGTPLMQANGMDLHESQSRIWEVCLGTSREFFRWVHQWYSTHAPAHLSGLSADELFQMASEVKPSLIRTEADPVSYGMHIMIRYELEKKIFAGAIAVSDLPAAWDLAYQESLGVSPTSVSEGILQDSHWSSGGFGYFPSYLLGTMIACQLHESLQRQFPQLARQVERGDLQQVRNWLKENVHQYGRGVSTQTMLQRATGRALDSSPFLHFLKERFID